MKNKNKLNKKIKAALASIFVGLIGSFLWEVIIRPSTSYLFDKFFSFIGHFSNTFSDDLYKTISFGPQGNNISVMFISVILLLFVIGTIDILTSILPNKDNEESPRNLSALVWLCLGHFVFIGMFLTGQHAFTESRAIKLNSNIEILSPYVTDTDYKMLKSKFRSIDSKDSYDLLNDELDILAKVHGLKLK